MTIGRGERGDYANFTVINFILRCISSDDSLVRSILIDCSGGYEVLHIYFLMNRLSGPRITNFGSLNECFSDYGISVNITQALKRITFAASSKGGGGGGHGTIHRISSSVGTWRNVVLICIFNLINSKWDVLDINLCICDAWACIPAHDCVCLCRLGWDSNKTTTEDDRACYCIYTTKLPHDKMHNRVLH